MVYNVFQLSFKLKRSIRGKLFSIIWDTECCLLVSSQHLVTITKSLWFPFRFSDYKTRQFPTNVMLRAKDLLHYLFVRCNPGAWELIIIKISCQSFISTGYHTTLPPPSFQELNSNPRLFIMFILHNNFAYSCPPKHFSHHKFMFWSFPRPFRIPCSTW